MDFSIYNRLSEIIATIPPIVDNANNYDVNFMYGSHEDLLRYLKLERQSNRTIYPLIWLETPIELKNSLGNKGYIEANFIIANLANQDMVNTDRVIFNFEKFINPITVDLFKALKTSGTTKYSDESTMDYFNYLPEEKGASDIWDVKQIQMNLTFKNNCKLKNIYYGQRM